ncbi:MAG: hypothetical protein J6X55_13280 [Victivallales bacterium]|nr:hypothetical protein [Victivallales bacterium]
MSKLLGYIRISGDLHLFGKEMVRDCLGYQANVIGDDVCGMGGDCDIAVEEDTHDKGRLCVFSGTLLNLPELLKEHGKCGNAAELCLELFDKHGNDFAQKFNGPFSFVIFDRKAGQLLCCRDQLGQSAFFYSMLTNGYVIFSNDLTVLRRLPGSSGQVDVTALSDYLSLGYVPAPKTIFHGISKLTAGHWMLFHMNGGLPSLHRYWHPQFTPKQKLTLSDATAQAWSLIDKAVNRCLAVQKSTAVLLSGGIDSNLVMALCAASATPVDISFTVGFPESDYDERRLAARSAEVLHVRNVQAEVMPESWLELSELQRLNGEPYADSSIIPTTAAMRLAAQNGIQQIFTGSGGDEVFGGYRRYQAMRLRALLGILPAWLLKTIGSIGLALTPHGATGRSRLATLRRFASFLKQDTLNGYAGFQEIFSGEMKAQLVHDWHLREQPSYLETWNDLIENGTAKDLVEQFNEVDVLTYLPEDGCTKERLAGLATGVLGLCPMLDMEVVEFGLSLRRSQRVTLGERKRILRRIGQALLAPELLKQTKRGFGMPVAAWFRGPYADAARGLAEELRQWDEQGWFEEQEVKRIVDEHLSGYADHGARLWTLLCLRRWLNK